MRYSDPSGSSSASQQLPLKTFLRIDDLLTNDWETHP